MRNIQTKTLIINIVSGIISLIIGILVASLYDAMHNVDIDVISDAEFFRLIGAVLLIGSVVTIIIFIAVSFVLMKIFITNGIIKLELQTREIIKGNYISRVNVKQRDQVGKLANTYNRMLDELQKNEYLSKSFIRDYSHEIKTPLSSINGLATLISEQNDMNKIKEYANIIQYESNRLAVMSVDLLKISELESTNVVDLTNEMNIAEIIRDILLVTEPLWSSRGISLNIDIADVKYTSSITMIHSVLLNLISNAIKYAPEDSEVLIKLEEKEHIVFTISNIGELTLEEQEEVFKLFYTTDKNKAKRSSGVGLALVNRIAKKIDAKIDLVNANGIVSFIVTF